MIPLLLILVVAPAAPTPEVAPVELAEAMEWFGRGAGPRRGVDTATLARWFVVQGTARGVDPVLLAALSHFESFWNNEAVSHAGYCGLMQVPSRAPGWRRNKPSVAWHRSHPFENIGIGAEELAWRVEACGGDLHCGLCMYHRGPTDWCRGRTTSYTRGVLWTYDTLRRHIDDDPVELLQCDVEIPLDDILLVSIRLVPMYATHVPRFPRPSVRGFRSTFLNRTLDRMRYDLCAQGGRVGDDYKECIHAKGRTASCDPGGGHPE